MAHIVEDGTGVARANAYSGLAEALEYHTTRGNTTWVTASDADQQSAIVRATDYIDQRFGAQFLGRKEFIDAVINATGHLRILAANAQNNDEITVGTQVYVMTTSAPSAPFEVQIGADATATAFNVAAAINVSGTPGTEYGVGTTVNTDVTAAHETGGPELVITAILAGLLGNGIELLSDSDRLIWDLPETSGGTDSGEQPLEFPRTLLNTRSGTPVTGIPKKLKNATYEYALRALTITLWVEPVTDSTGLRLIKNRRKVGPIETELEYAESQNVRTIRPIRAADKYLEEYIATLGGLIRG